VVCADIWLKDHRPTDQVQRLAVIALLMAQNS
jgi:hypothetical protein